jgi:adenylate cyclase
MAEKDIKRKLAAILSAEADGYSRLVDEDADAAVRTLTACREVLGTLIQQHNGNELDSFGGNLLVEFASAVDALQCAVAFQKEIKTRNDELPENRRLQFRIGINFSNVIQEEDWIYGDDAGIAASLGGLAEPGGIFISRTAFKHVEGKLPYGYELVEDQRENNIVQSMGAYRVLTEPRVSRGGRSGKQKPAESERMPFLLAASGILVPIVAVIVWHFYLAFGLAAALAVLGFGLCLLYMLYFKGF